MGILGDVEHPRAKEMRFRLHLLHVVGGAGLQRLELPPVLRGALRAHGPDRRQVSLLLEVPHRCSVSTLGISTLFRVVRRTQNGKGASESNADPLPESAVLIPYRAITVNRGRTGRERCRREGFGRLFGVRDEKVTR
jgi:hypothetical protein